MEESQKKQEKLENELDFHKNLVETYRIQCSKMAEEIISLRSQLAQANFESARYEIKD